MYDSIIQWISVIGSVASIVGIPFTLFQVWRVKIISKRTLAEFNKTDAISDISKCIEMINEAAVLLKDEQFEKALTNMKSIKAMIIQMKVIVPQFELSKSQKDVGDTINSHINSLQENINTIHRYHKSPNPTLTAESFFGVF